MSKQEASRERGSSLWPSSAQPGDKKGYKRQQGVAGGGEQARGARAASGAGDLVLGSQVRQAPPCTLFLLLLQMIPKYFCKYFPLFLGPVERILPYFILCTKLTKTSPCLEKTNSNWLLPLLFHLCKPIVQTLKSPKATQISNGGIREGKAGKRFCGSLAPVRNIFLPFL